MPKKKKKISAPRFASRLGEKKKRKWEPSLDLDFFCLFFPSHSLARSCFFVFPFRECPRRRRHRSRFPLFSNYISTNAEKTKTLSIRVRRRRRPQLRLQPLEKHRDATTTSVSSSAHLPRRPRRPSGQPHRRGPELTARAAPEPHRNVSPPEAHRRQETSSFTQNGRKHQPEALSELRGRRGCPRRALPARVLEERAHGPREEHPADD